MSNLMNRLDRLEDVLHPKRPVVVWRNHDETEDAATARWCADHLGEPNPDNVQLIRCE
jgi:hypothetical protein